MSRFSLVARRYAQALYGLAEGPAQGQDWLHLLERARKVLADPALGRDGMACPIFPIPDSVTLVTMLAGQLQTDATVRAFLQLLARKRRLCLLPDICREISALQDEALGRVHGTLVTAVSMEEGQIERIRQGLGALLSKEVILSVRLDAGLGAGFWVGVGDRVFDLSARAYLDSMELKLLQNG